MHLAHLLPFAGVSLLLAVTPGPDMALVTRNALAYGRRGVLLTTSGIALALTLHVAATTLGLSALLRASPSAFGVLKLAGGAYLAYLGVRSWLATRHLPPPPDTLAAAAPREQILRQGFFSALLNPKLAVFFLTFLPQFVDPAARPVPQFLTLGLLFAAIGWSWLNLYGLLVDRVRAVVTSSRARRWMERLSGTVLIGLGARLVLEWP